MNEYEFAKFSDKYFSRNCTLKACLHRVSSSSDFHLDEGGALDALLTQRHCKQFSPSGTIYVLDWSTFPISSLFFPITSTFPFSLLSWLVYFPDWSTLPIGLLFRLVSTTGPHRHSVYHTMDYMNNRRLGHSKAWLINHATNPPLDLSTTRTLHHSLIHLFSHLASFTILWHLFEHPQLSAILFITSSSSSAHSFTELYPPPQ